MGLDDDIRAERQKRDVAAERASFNERFGIGTPLVRPQPELAELIREAIPRVKTWRECWVVADPDGVDLVFHLPDPSMAGGSGFRERRKIQARIRARRTNIQRHGERRRIVELGDPGRSGDRDGHGSEPSNSVSFLDDGRVSDCSHGGKDLNLRPENLQILRAAVARSLL